LLFIFGSLLIVDLALIEFMVGHYAQNQASDMGCCP
jgi:hypothetical protein